MLTAIWTKYRPMTRSFWFSVGIFFLFNGAFFIFDLLQPIQGHNFVLADDIGQAIGWFIATLLCFVGIERWRIHTSLTSQPFRLQRYRRLVPLFFAFGIFSQCVGQIIYTYYDFNNWKPFPSWADVAYLSTSPFFMAAILLLPTRPFSGVTRTRILLDGFMTMAALVTFSWYFVLGPTLIQGGGTPLATVVGSAYPTVDLILIFSIIWLAFRAKDVTLSPTVFLLSLGLTIIVITDSAYDYLNLKGTYTNGWMDVGWPVGYMLIGLAAQAFSISRKKRLLTSATPSGDNTLNEEVAANASRWYSILPYILIPLVLLLALYAWQTNDVGYLASGVYIGGALLIILILIRQLFATWETIYFNKELQRIQAELRKKNHDLREANMLLEKQSAEMALLYEQQVHLNELKDQFLLNVNHELRTPLTEIRGFLNLLTEYGEKIDPPTRATFLSHAVHGTEELLRLVNNVLDAIRGDLFSRSPQLADLNVANEVRRTLDIFEPQKQQEYTLELEIADSLYVKADEQYLHQILLNLLSNAFKYSPKQTTICVSAKVCASDVAAGDEAAQSVLICVKDAGPGIPPLEIPLLFGKFARLKRDLTGNVRGTGLGLYISKQLVEAMQGKIWVESTGVPGEGSRFCFTLPLALVEEGEPAYQGESIQ